ncbi:MAG: amino acid ABC transporter substrate-binding protein [Burkholderiaceae bacterium]|nr:amino acid ABC transporter substrate-binding protein [Ideonella sp.]MCC7287097.1 amino acid ABC transporter substrate-binding protein [Burkholderiaceae bacterium]
MKKRAALSVMASAAAAAMWPMATLAQAPTEIRIGAPISLTGQLAADGLDQKWAYEQAVADINAKGGIMIKKAGKKLPVKLVIADDQSDPAKVTDAMERLIKIEKVDLLLSTHGGDLNMAGALAAEKYKKFYMITTMWPHMWTPKKFKWSALFFFDAGGGAEVPFMIWETLPEKERPKKPALVMEDSPDGQGFGGVFKAMAKKHKVNLVMDEPWAMGAKDYSAYILKMKARGADAVLLFGNPVDAITLVRQMKEQNFSVPYLHGWKGTWPYEFREALGDSSNYVLADGFWSMDYPYPGAKDLGERYMKEHNNKSNTSVGMFYANAQVLLKAIENTGTVDSKAVHDAIVGKAFKGTVQGDVKFDAAGLALITSTANQWWNGRHMLVYPHQKGGWSLKLAPPWDQRK